MRERRRFDEELMITDTPMQIAACLSCTRNRCAGDCADYGPPAPDKKTPIHWGRGALPHDDLPDLLARGMTIQEAATHYQVNPGTIRNWIRKMKKPD